MFTRITDLQTDDDPSVVLENFDQAQRDAYWKDKNVLAAILIGLAGIQYGLSHEDEKLRSQAKTLAYNLASFTWPGWDEADIVLDPTAVQIGYEAAQLNLQLAIELKKGDMPMCRAHWMVGAFQLALGLESKQAFEESARFAEKGGEPGEVLLAQGFARLPSTPDQLTDIQEKLQSVEHGDAFWGQIETAARVFAPK